LAKTVKIGVRQGSGPPPGYQWTVRILAPVHDEAFKFLSKAQYEHLALQVRELARHEDPTHSDVLSIDKIEDFYELRDKGGVLGKLNVRIFFGVDKENHEHSIVILGAIKKENDGPTSDGDKIRIRRRWRRYLNGDYGRPERRATDAE